MENDQDRWEYEVQRHERDEFQNKVWEGIVWGIGCGMLAAIVWVALCI